MVTIKKARFFFVLFVYSFFLSAEIGLQNHKLEVSFNPVQLSHKKFDYNNCQHETQAVSYANPVQYHYALMSVADFQRIFHDVPEGEILSNYELFAFENFRTYVRTLSGYNDYILSLEAKIKSDRNFRKKTAYISGFEYHFSLRSEKSGFHDFIAQEVCALRAQKNKKTVVTQQGILQINNTQKLDRLAQQWSSRKNFAGDTIRLQNRLNALHKVRNTHGRELDCQLQKELCESRNAIKELERNFAHSHHVQVLSPVVDHCAAQAAKEHCPIVAFGLSDFCHTITQILSHGTYVLYDATCAIGKGIGKSAQIFTSIEHWKDMATGMLQLGLLFTDAVGQEEDFHYAAALAKFSEKSDVVVNFAENYCVYTQAQKDLINRYAQETYQKIKSMSWQELLEGGTEIGTTMILDTLALHALSGFTKATSNAFISRLQRVVENEALFVGEYAVEVAGFGKLIVEEGAEIVNEASDIITNNFDFTDGANKNIVKTVKDTIVACGKRIQKKGSLLIEQGGKFSESEKRAAQYMCDLGNDVILRIPKGTRVGGGTSDLLVNGLNYDVYTPLTNNPDRIVTAIADKKNQAVGIVLDLSQTAATIEQLGDIKMRLIGKGAINIKEVIVLK